MNRVNPRVTGISAERHWPGGGGVWPPRLTTKPMNAASRARRRWKGLDETVLNTYINLLRASAKREASFYWYTLKIWVWAARRPCSRFWEAYISGTVSPFDKRSSLVGSPIPSAVHGTNAESCQCQLGHVARATWGDVTNVPPAVSR